MFWTSLSSCCLREIFICVFMTVFHFCSEEDYRVFDGKGFLRPHTTTWQGLRVSFSFQKSSFQDMSHRQAFPGFHKACQLLVTFNYSFSACHHQSASAGAREVTLFLPAIGRFGPVVFHNLRGSRVQCSRTCSLWYSPVLQLKEQSSVCARVSVFVQGPHSTSTRGAVSSMCLHLQGFTGVWCPTLMFISCVIRFLLFRVRRKINC